MSTPNPVEQHYQRGAILGSILAALREMGKDLNHLTPSDLAPVDEFHIRGRQATIELAARASIKPGERVLDVGCGLGGSARYLASECGASVTGIDLTREYIDVARELARLVGMADQVAFHQADALAIPFPDASFDVVWTEHAQMNIADKDGFYSEIARVLAPGGRLVFHDIFRGPGDEPLYPVPWAESADISHLASADQLPQILDRAGFDLLDWEDKSEPATRWFDDLFDHLADTGPMPLGLHLLMGATRKEKLLNLAQNLRESRVVVFQAVARKRN